MSRKIKTLAVLCLLTGCASTHIQSPSSTSHLTGIWKLKSFECEGGVQDSLVKMNAEEVASGRREETISFDQGKAKQHSVFWTDPKKTGACIYDT